MSSSLIDVPGQPFSYESSLEPHVKELEERVRLLRASGRLDAAVLGKISSFFRIRSIFNSNAIEGNELSEGETRRVVEQGLTIAGRSMKDHLEAQNLAHALDFFETLATSSDPIAEHDIRQIRQLILNEISTTDAGRYRTVDVIITGSTFKPTAQHDVPREMRHLGEWIQRPVSGKSIARLSCWLRRRTLDSRRYTRS